MKSLLRGILFPFGLLLILISISSFVSGYNWWDVAFPRQDAAYVMPKGAKLLYNKNTKEYCAIVPDCKFDNLNDLRLRKYYFVLMDLWAVVNTNPNFYRSSDSSKVKFLVHLYMDNQKKISSSADFHLVHRDDKVQLAHRVKLKKGDLFYLDYAGLEKGLVVDTNERGVYFTLPDKWMHTSVEFETFDELDKDKTFKILTK